MNLPKIYWRIAIPFLVVTLALAFGLFLVLTRTSCLGNPECVLRSVFLTTGLALATVLLVSWIIARRTTRPIRELTEVAQRLAAGDDTARVLLHRRDEIGGLIRAFNAMTERQRERYNDLAQANVQSSAVLEHMADGVIITDEAGMVTLINPAARALLNMTEMDALGMSFAALVRHHTLIELWQRCRKQRTEQTEAVEVSPQLFLQAVASPYRAGEAEGFVILLQDLTQVRRLQVMRRDFITNLSHELRSPLASLRAVVDTLHAGAIGDPPAAERFLGQASSEIDTMTQMVEELTQLSQIESGQIRLRLEAEDLGVLLEMPLERTRPQAEAAGLTLTVDVPSDLPPVLVDGERIRQVVTNLLHNAIKFTPPGGQVTVSGRVEAAEEGSSPKVVVEVRDTGIGIPKIDLPRIFERFYKSDRARTRGKSGTGLGLAIARHIVETHGGRLWVKSKEGKGSSFFFSLPIATAAAGADSGG